MVHRVPHIGERLVALFHLQGEKLFLEFFHRAVERRTALGLRVTGGELERTRLGRAALYQRIHYQFRAMGEHPFRVQLAIATRRYAQPQERTQQVARDKTWPSRDGLAIVDQTLRRQLVFEPPRHTDRVVVLYVLGQRGFAHANDRFTQTRDAEPGRETSAKPDFVDKRQRGLFIGHAARPGPAEVVVAMRLEALKGSHRYSIEAGLEEFPPRPRLKLAGSSGPAPCRDVHLKPGAPPWGCSTFF